MANIGHSLMIKYGLRAAPEQAKIDQWVKRTEEYINKGHDPEDAGRKAAKDIFPDYDQFKYAAQADTILALLAQARNR